MTAFSADAQPLDAAAALDAVRAAARRGRAASPSRFASREPPSPPGRRHRTVHGDRRDPLPRRQRPRRDRRRFSATLARRPVRIRFRGVATRPRRPRSESRRRRRSRPARGELGRRRPPRPRTAQRRGGSSTARSRPTWRYERARQYQAFLANPDPFGPSRTTYVYSTTASRGPRRWPARSRRRPRRAHAGGRRGRPARRARRRRALGPPVERRGAGVSAGPAVASSAEALGLRRVEEVVDPLDQLGLLRRVPVLLEREREEDDLVRAWNDRASGIAASSVKIACAGAIGVIRFSKSFWRTVFESGTVPTPSVSVPATAWTLRVSLSFCASEPSQSMCR